MSKRSRARRMRNQKRAQWTAFLRYHDNLLIRLWRGIPDIIDFQQKASRIRLRGMNIRGTIWEGCDRKVPPEEIAACMDSERDC